MFIEFEPHKTRPQPSHDRQWTDELADILPPIPLQPLQQNYRLSHFALLGIWQGALAGCVSLLLNVIGSVLWPAISHTAQHPLRLIQVFLTFPLGGSALQLESGALLALGCLLYVFTGMVYGLLIVVLLSYFFPNAHLPGRLILCSLLAIAIWAANIYGLLYWLQPWLFGGRWIAELLPWWVGALTHLAFGWTIALTYPLSAGPTGESQDSADL
jgi:hypothetical protein